MLRAMLEVTCPKCGGFANVSATGPGQFKTTHGGSLVCAMPEDALTVEGVYVGWGECPHMKTAILTALDELAEGGDAGSGGGPCRL